MSTILAAVLLLMGGLFAFVAAVGVVRLPDLLVRMHAATKAGTLGAGLIFLGVALFDMETGVMLRALAAIFFLFLTAPVSAHLIGRAAYRSGIRIWDRTRVDELEEYCRTTGYCEGWELRQGSIGDRSPERSP